MSTTINIIVFGIGNVGSTLINQIIEKHTFFKEKFHVDLKIPVITNSKKALFTNTPLSLNWENDFQTLGQSYTIEDVFNYVNQNQLENIIAIDVTANDEIVQQYIPFVQNNFNIVAANKKANTLHLDFYNELRRVLQQNDKQFLYETNVGAGLPVINTIQDLHLAGEKITKIRGVFSGTISYIFNRFGTENLPFSKILVDAEKLGLTEPDSREDLSGNDVARKLLILSRELELNNEFKDVKITSLTTEKIDALSKRNYSISKELFDKEYEIAKITQPINSVLRYIGELDVVTNTLEVKLVSVPENSALGQLKGADNLIEIFTESYGEIPIVIQGAGAGKKVTARGVLSDVIKLAKQIKKQNLVPIV
ncbi:aspartate kinase [Flavobacterium jejuense]|uniref:Homoserine dehydrogenase n=1 Tax=Flavobacterium jejuense TaxID=1544455 RepID=A0ABX0IWT7_9FLAO|nr:aspartate kinase [Flavobacterium jejuense]NHN27646.1 aspartate kinase [Flavobacterium jejuense]